MPKLKNMDNSPNKTLQSVLPEYSLSKKVKEILKKFPLEIVHFNTENSMEIVYFNGEKVNASYYKQLFESEISTLGLEIAVILKERKDLYFKIGIAFRDVSSFTEIPKDSIFYEDPYFIVGINADENFINVYMYKK